MCNVAKTASAFAPDAQLSSIYKTDHSSSPNRSLKTKRCGACGNEGHTRANATEHNCPAYNDEKELDRREKIREKREHIIAEERVKIRAIENESVNADRMQDELKRQIEELERNKERAEEFRKEELKKRKQKVKRLEKKRQNN